MTNQQLQEIKKIKDKFKAGGDYTECHNLAMPFLIKMNKQAKALAKKFGRRYYPLTFNDLMR